MITNSSIDTDAMVPGCGCPACLRGNDPGIAPLGNDSPAFPSDNLSPNSRANDLLSGYAQGPGNGSPITLTYKFHTGYQSYWANDPAFNYFGMSMFTVAQQNAVRDILGHISDFTKITFVEVSDSTNPAIGFVNANDIYFRTDLVASAYYPTGWAGAGDVFVNKLSSYYSDTPVAGGYPYYTLLHEIGHTLGLQHSFTAGLTGAENTEQYSVMAYDTSPWGHADQSAYVDARTYMLYDIYSLQQLYGADTSYNAGNTTYDLESGQAYTIWDGGGTDTLNGAHIATGMTLNLDAGTFSSVGLTDNIAIAYNVVIENAIGGSGNDTFYGNNAANSLIGNGGNDHFHGSRGNDTIDGVTGTDTVEYTYALTDFIGSIIDATTITLENLIDSFTDTLSNIDAVIFDGVSYLWDDLITIFTPPPLLDPIEVSFFWGTESYAFTSNIAVTDMSVSAAQMGYTGTTGEVFTYTRAGNDFDITNSGAPALVEINGSANDDTLTIRGVPGIRVIAHGGSGNDLIYITGALDQGDALYGDDGDDTLRGSLGNDYISGGNDNDTLRGEEGHDTLYGDDGDDDIRGGEGHDRLYGGAGNDQLTGGYNSSDAFISHDLMDGGAGNDEMRGYLGDDTYIYSSGLDYIYDTDGFEILKIDAAFAPEDISFADNPSDTNDLVIVLNAGLNEINIENQKSSNAAYHIERIAFADGFYADLARHNDWTFGTASGERLDGSNPKDDIIILGDGDDTAYGKDGDDVIHGGDGADTLRGDNGNDRLYGGDGDDDIRGKADDDILFGGAGNDTLYGDVNNTDTETGNDILDGGEGDDELRGGLGDDLYIVSAGLDYIFDRGGNDTLRLTGASDITALSFAIDPTDVTDLIITINPGTDHVHIENQLSSDPARHIETLILADGSSATLDRYKEWTFADPAGERIDGSYNKDDTIIGGAGNDLFFGKDGDDELFGGAGNDSLRGDNGNDLLHGGSGNDDLRGYDGDDTLYAGAGADKMLGGTGADRFVLSGTDVIDGNLNRILDFNLGENDVLEFINLLEGYDPLTDAITDFITLSESGGHTILSVDIDGTGTTYTAQDTVRIENLTGQWSDADAMITAGDLIVMQDTI